MQAPECEEMASTDMDTDGESEPALILDLEGVRAVRTWDVGWAALERDGEFRCQGHAACACRVRETRQTLGF